RISPVLEDVPNETTVDDKIQKKKSAETTINAALIHDPEKPLKKEIPAEKKTAIPHPSSNEKPSPAPTKNPLVKKEAGKQKEAKPAEKIQRVPKAVMLPQSDY